MLFDNLRFNMGPQEIGLQGSAASRLTRVRSKSANAASIVPSLWTVPDPFNILIATTLDNGKGTFYVGHYSNRGIAHGYGAGCR